MPSVLYAISKTLPEGRVRSTVETVAGRTRTSYASRSRPTYSTHTKYVSYKEAEESGTPGTGKVGRIIDYVSGDLPEGRVRDAVGIVSGRVFTRISPPPSFKKRVDLPLEIYSSGQPRATELYYRLAYQGYMGRDTGRTGRQLSGELGKSRHWWMTYARFEGGRSWKDVKREDSALYLGLNLSSIRFQPEYNFLRFQQEQTESIKQRVKGKGWFAEFAGQRAVESKAFGTVVLKGFADPGFWISSDKAGFLASAEYGMQKRIWSGDIGGYLWEDVVKSPAMTNIVYTGMVAGGIGAAIGGFKATAVGSKVLFNIGKHSLTVGKSVELGIAGYGTYEVGKAAVHDPLGTGVGLLISGPFAYMGYKSGHGFGYGRMEAYLYAKHMFKPGSPEMIRFKSAIKVSRKLQFVKSDYSKPLDFAKDIMRLKPSDADKVIGYLKSHPKTVVGGSASMYTQVKPSVWKGWRDVSPRDLDLLAKDVGGAKSFFKGRLITSKGQHRIDIHGFDFAGTGGKYYRFGFFTQRPRTIGGFRTLKLGEQSFRKGIGGTSVETGYRWFKDRPDFQMISEQLIGSGKKSLNPFTRWRVSSASKHFDIFKHPYKSKSYGKPDTKVGGFIKKYVKPAPSPKAVDIGGGYVDYVYPGYTYPSGIAGFGLGYYPSSVSATAKYIPPKIVKPSYPAYKPPRTIIPSVITTYKPDKPYKPTGFKPPDYVPPYTPPDYSPPYIPDYTPTDYPPAYYPDSPIPPVVPPPPPPVITGTFVSKRRKPDPFDELFGKKYKFRKFKVVDILKELGV